MTWYDAIYDKQHKPIATLRIRGAGGMNERQRRELALWLNRQAASLVEHGHEYMRNFQACCMRRVEDQVGWQATQESNTNHGTICAQRVG